MDMNTPKQDRAVENSGPRWTRRKEERPGEILDAALQVFAEKGFSATRLEDVAARAGISKGTLYLYFSDKEDIFRSVVEHAVVPNIDQFEDALAGDTRPAEQQLRDVLTRLAVLIATTPMGAVPKLVIAEAGNFPGIAAFYRDRVILRIQGIFEMILKRGVAAGEFRDIDTEYASRILASPMFFLAIVKNLPPVDEVWQIDPERHAAVALDMFLGGLLNGPAGKERTNG